MMTPFRRNPSADEICDGLDNNCYGDIDLNATDAVTWYEDLDEDGYGNPNVFEMTCTPSTGFVDNDSDCDDTEVLANVLAEESCDGIDNDCDSIIDNDVVLGTEALCVAESCAPSLRPIHSRGRRLLYCRQKWSSHRSFVRWIFAMVDGWLSSIHAWLGIIGFRFSQSHHSK